VATLSGAGDAHAFYHQMLSLKVEPFLDTGFVRSVNGLLDSATAWNDASLTNADAVHQMMYLDAVTYLPDDILTKVDRASMGVSLEARVPLLDHRVVELAWRIPTTLKVKDGTGKWILRQLLKQYVPEPLFERPKSGFGVPVGMWLRKDLREWAEALLNKDRLKQQGVFDSAAVHTIWEAHLAGTGLWLERLWRVLMFQAWYDTLKR
jgi:asparagine synthase (glutamine-hydrolysing)